MLRWWLVMAVEAWPRQPPWIQTLSQKKQAVESREVRQTKHQQRALRPKTPSETW